MTALAESVRLNASTQPRSDSALLIMSVRSVPFGGLSSAVTMKATAAQGLGEARHGLSLQGRGQARDDEGRSGSPGGTAIIQRVIVASDPRGRAGALSYAFDRPDRAHARVESALRRLGSRPHRRELYSGKERGGRRLAVKAPGCGPGDRGFESLRPPHKNLPFGGCHERRSGTRSSGSA